MLLRFTVANYRSISNAVTLSFIAVDERNPKSVSPPGVAHDVMSVVGIFGANASGKSNVLGAVDWLSWAVASSLVLWDDVIPRQPFLFDGNVHLPTAFEVDLVADGVRYSYELEVDDLAVRREALFAYPKGRSRKVFVRDSAGGLSFHDSVERQGAIAELVTDTTLVLSAGSRLGAPPMRAVAAVLGGVVDLTRHGRAGRSLTARRQRFARTHRIFRASVQPALFEDGSELRNRATALLAAADLGIVDAEVRDLDDPGALGGPAGRPFGGMRLGEEVRLVHQTESGRVSLPLSEESHGTQLWFELIGPLLSALDSGGFVVIDEIDEGLHPHLVAELVRRFQDPESNRRGAQLLFSSHDVSILDVLNRDEVWFTEKDAHGSTSLFGLMEFGRDAVRHDTNIARGYLLGRYGAVPEIDSLLVDAAVGNRVAVDGET